MNKITLQWMYFFTFMALVAFIGWDVQNEINQKDAVQTVSAVEFVKPSKTVSKPVKKQKVQDFSFLTELPNNHKEIISLISEEFGKDAYIAVRVAHCESRLRQNRINVNTDGSLDVGLFQINQKWHADKGNAYDLKQNIKIAKQVFDESGWKAWVCYNKYSKGW